jgi:hypothetical protein
VIHSAREAGASRACDGRTGAAAVAVVADSIFAIGVLFTF